MSYHGNKRKRHPKQNLYNCIICGTHGCNKDCVNSYDCQPKQRVHSPKKRKILIEKAPSVKTFKDLIVLAKKEYVLYSNINTAMLRNICPQLEELDTLIGMEELKESIFDQILYYLQNMHTINKNDLLHTCIMGNPGCGKTTVAKIIAKMYKNAGILSNNGVFKIAGRADLIGKYLGQTSPKTKAFLESCIGGVLFIDEIYSLGSGEARGTDSFSKECIDCINQFLYDHKNDFCLIVAGYEKEIKQCFFSVNAGLERRFPWMHTIKEYEPNELSQIATKMLKDIKWKTATKEDDLTEIIKESKDMFKHAGGSVENWITKVKVAHSRRVFALDYKDKYVLSKKDFEEGLKMMKKHNLTKVKASEPPSGMYT
jgi:Holliday junction resolvasome RuvABC ATP-dependent DNA helicase subunit